MQGERARVVATVGLHGSASTWVFNVARELMIASAGEAGVLSLYADEVARIPDAGAVGERVLVMKSHHGGPGLDEWLAAAEARVLLSVRDPRDAAVSMAKRFDAPIGSAVRWLATDCVRMRRLVDAGHAVFRYEDRFFEDQGAVARMAGLLGVDVGADVIDLLSERYRPEAVRAFAQTIEALPADRLVRSGAIVFDDRTQIHVTHMGDAQSGKWRELPEAVQAGMIRSLRPFLEAFGYPV
jgi:hypothetical protein